MSLFQSFRRRTGQDWMCLMEAALLHLFVVAGLRILTYLRLQRWCEHIARIPRRAPSSMSQVMWAVSVVSRRIGGGTCLAEAAVAYTMLRRHGHDPRLRIGVRHGESTLDAHAWVECEGMVVAGALPEMTGYAMLR
jgi:Transglutaminase-like superfamily